MSISPETLNWICAQIKEIESRIKDAEALIARLKAIGEPVDAQMAQLAELRARYERLKKGFPDCS